MNKGKFITLEGLDGAGKTTQLIWLAEFLQRNGKNIILTREPGGTALGEKLRDLLLDNNLIMHAETEALLMFAARREHLEKIICPALENGDWVISDRFTDASFAYQGGGRQVEISKLEVLEQWTQGMLQPDLTLYFDVPVALGRARVSRIKLADRFEKEQADFFHRARNVYLERVRKFPDRMHMIDATQSIQAVQESIKHVLESTIVADF